MQHPKEDRKADHREESTERDRRRECNHKYTQNPKTRERAGSRAVDNAGLYYISVQPSDKQLLARSVKKHNRSSGHTMRRLAPLARRTW